MKSILLFIVGLAIGITSNAQVLDNKTYSAETEKPIIILNSEIIGNVDILKNISPEDISMVNIIKNQEFSTTHLFPMDKQETGIIEVQTNVKIEAKTQEALNIFFGLNKTNDIYPNGYLIEDKKKTIATENIKKIELLKANGILLKASALNITM